MRTRSIDKALDIAKKQGMSQADFARKLGVSKQAVTNWLDRGLPTAKVALAADMLRVTIDELLGRSLGGIKHPGRVPVINLQKSKDWIETGEVHSHSRIAYAYTTKDVSDRAFAAQVESDAMVAGFGMSFPEGCHIIVDPRLRTPRDRAFVVARLQDTGTTVFRQYRVDEIQRSWLQPLNQQHEPIRGQFEIIGTVVQKLEDIYP